MKKFFTFCCAALMASGAAFATIIGSIDYTFNSDGTATVIGYDSNVTLGDLVIPATVTLADDVVFNVTTIGDRAFRRCSSLTSVSMPSVTTIGLNAFYNCTELTSVSMPKVVSIGTGALSGCSYLTSVSMPEVTTIGTGAFQSCSDLNSVSMPKVESIGSAAFFACNFINAIYVGATPATLNRTAEFNDLVSLTPNATLYVPAGAKATYENTDGWSVFNNIVEMATSYTRDNRTAGNYYTFCLPDVVTSIEGGTPWAISEVVYDNSGNVYGLNVQEVDMTNGIPAGVPFLVLANASTITANYDWTAASASEGSTQNWLVGNPGDAAVIPSGCYFISGNKIWQIAEATDANYIAYSVPQYQAYINLGTASAAPARAKAEDNNSGFEFTFVGEPVFMPCGETAGLNAIEAEASADAPRYNAFGQRIMGDAKGFQIVNGKKAIKF